MSAETVTSQSLRIRPSGDRAVLVEVPSLEHAFGLRKLLKEAPLAGIEDIVVTISSVLVIVKSARNLRHVIEYLNVLAELPSQGRSGKQIEIDVLYDGEDLDPLATILGWSSEAFVNWHSGQVWTAAFTGFAPGFVYLISDNGILVPRRDTPRAAVPAGSLAMAESYSAVYPRGSAGGWQLIGRTGAQLWDEQREDPALIHPGDSVTFVPSRVIVRTSGATAQASPVKSQTDRAADLIVENPGVLTTFQDRGRFGKADLGVGSGGAMDRAAQQLVNELLGNDVSDAVLEVYGVGFSMLAESDQVVAVSGAASDIVVETREAGRDGLVVRRLPEEPFVLFAGQRLRILESDFGVWSYIGVRGGFDVASVLGSKSRDMHSGIGPAPLVAGSALFVGETNVSMVVGQAHPTDRVASDIVHLRVIPGPRFDWFTPAAQERFFAEPWTATHQGNRTAVRLQGDALERAREEELPSEGVVRGSIQVPSDGQPLIFSADYPVTGGYPVIAVVVNDDLDTAAQISPGQTVHFHRIEMTHAAGSVEE